MSIKSRTIDNLGMETSVRYAKDVEQLDTRMIEDSKWISKRIEIPATKPYVQSEFDKLFAARPSTQWALFSPPPAFEAHSRALFSYQLVPSLGSSEKQEADTEKLASFRDKEERREGREGEESEEEKEEEDERNRLLALLQCLGKFDKILGLINARRNQYQRG